MSESQFIRIKSDFRKLCPPVTPQTFKSMWFYVLFAQLVAITAMFFVSSMPPIDFLSSIPGWALFTWLVFLILKQAIYKKRQWARWIAVVIFVLQIVGSVAGLDFTAQFGFIAEVATIVQIPMLGLLVYWLVERSPRLWPADTALDHPAADNEEIETGADRSSSRSTWIVLGALVVLAVLAFSFLSESIPTCSNDQVTSTLEKIIEDQVSKHQSFAWMKPLMLLPAVAGEGKPFNILLANERENSQTKKLRHCSVDVDITANDQWADQRLARMGNENMSEQERKIVLGTVSIGRITSKATGDRIQTSLKYSVQRTDNNDVYVEIE